MNDLPDHWGYEEQEPHSHTSNDSGKCTTYLCADGLGPLSAHCMNENEQKGEGVDTHVLSESPVHF